LIPYIGKFLIVRRIRSFDVSDKNRLTREADLNNLESFIYKVRDLLEDSNFTPFASKLTISEIESLIKSTSKWLSDSDDVATTSKALKEKLKGLEELVNPVKSRKEEATKRPELTSYLREALEQAKGLVDVISKELKSSKTTTTAIPTADSSETSGTTSAATSATGDPLADLEEADESTSTTSSEAAKSTELPFVSPYSEADLLEMQASYEAVNTWLESKLAEQSKLKDWEEPALTSEALSKKAKELNDALMNLLQRKLKKPTSNKGKSKKPKPTKKADKKAEKKEQKKEEPKAEPKDKIKDEL
jgi:hypoxia up-regulated 1